MRAEIPMIRYAQGIARDESGAPVASAEIIVLIFLDRIDALSEIIYEILISTIQTPDSVSQLFFIQCLF